MPVVERVDNPPVANDDDAFVVAGGSVTVDVLANDFDAEGPLAVTIVTPPTNGTADVTTDNRITYTHDGSATTSDSLVYEITDTAGQSDQATVFITIADECFAPAGDYSIDFESGSPGWAVDTAVLTPPSQTWQLLSPDAFASSGTTVWFTESLAQDPSGDTSKDVRLVTPEFVVSGDSHLTFYHRFRTEPGFDGGVLEVSVDGAAWQDILAAGGVFVAGEYNDILSPGSGFVLSGRRAWAGESNGFELGSMNLVDVDLGGLAGQTVSFRFRFAQDQLAPEAGGWWMDDFAVNGLLQPCGQPPVANDDNASVDAGMSVNVDVLANDSDPQYANSELTVTIDSDPSQGTAVVETDQTITYTNNGGSATSDSFVYRVANPDGGFDTATVTITINQPQNATPDAVDDEATVDRGGSTTIDVKANDSDADDANSELTVTIETPPTHGAAGVTADGQVTYTHNGDDATADSFQYRLTDPQGAFDIATVTITVNQAAADLRETTGGGYLLTPQGDKINFGFKAVEEEDGSLSGDLQLNDKKAKAKVNLKNVVTFNALADECGTVPPGEGSAEITGSGTFNGKAASFRVCVADFGESGSAVPDMFHLECTEGCDYSTLSRVDDEQIDGGNIQVHNPELAADEDGVVGDGSQSQDGDATASTLILGPVLLDEADAGSIQQLTVRAFGPDQQPLANAAISVDVLDATGALLETLTGESDASGVVTLEVLVGLGDTEYLAWSGSLSSNAILVSGVLR
ncbi:MAG: Ig-like domain-containing protein [Chloroflexota bacterium]|nr:Ig-like domain-containing protein [Chloroflexota bacterium]